jgi:antitoxin component HigA of HigAB toxin-antitoxin module
MEITAIKNKKQYNEYLTKIEFLMNEKDIDSNKLKGNELELLSILVDDYENKNYPIKELTLEEQFSFYLNTYINDYATGSSLCLKDLDQSKKVLHLRKDKCENSLRTIKVEKENMEQVFHLKVGKSGMSLVPLKVEKENKDWNINFNTIFESRYMDLTKYSNIPVQAFLTLINIFQKTITENPNIYKGLMATQDKGNIKDIFMLSPKDIEK